MDRIELNMVYSRSTKNKHILIEGNGNYDVETVQGLYVGKSAFDETEEQLKGKKFKLVIEEVED